MTSQLEDTQLELLEIENSLKQIHEGMADRETSYNKRVVGDMYQSGKLLARARDIHAEQGSHAGTHSGVGFQAWLDSVSTSRHTITRATAYKHIEVYELCEDWDIDINTVVSHPSLKKECERLHNLKIDLRDRAQKKFNSIYNEVMAYPSIPHIAWYIAKMELKRESPQNLEDLYWKSAKEKQESLEKRQAQKLKPLF